MSLQSWSQLAGELGLACSAADLAHEFIFRNVMMVCEAHDSSRQPTYDIELTSFVQDYVSPLIALRSLTLIQIIYVFKGSGVTGRLPPLAFRYCAGNLHALLPL